MKGVEIFLSNQKGEFELAEKHYESGIAKSTLLDGMGIDLKDIFQRP